MIIIKLQGGLGNQLFQWAYYKTLSQKYDVFLNDSFYKIQSKRKFGLNKFPNIKYRINNNYGPSFNQIVDNFHYNNIEFIGNLFMNGYWQSEKYFIENRNIILNELQVATEFNIIPKNMVNVSLHIRRGDYIEYNNIHPIQPIGYYENAIQIVGHYDNLFIFSDDMEWCRKNLKFNNMIFVENRCDVEDIWLMSLCNHNIIANSSFSWWGAWLNQNLNKKVVAPLNWFGSSSGLNSSDIIPESWIKI
jgi:hypothetical protein